MNLWNIPSVPQKGWKNVDIINLSGDSKIFGTSRTGWDMYA